MTKVYLQPGLLGLSGGMKGWVYSIRNGKTFVGSKQVFDTNREPTEAEVDWQKHFKKANSHAQALLADPATREFYEAMAKERGTPIFALAMGDVLNEPSILPLELSNYQGRIGDNILIEAEDDLGLADISVSIVAQDGTPIESGKAVEKGVRSGEWIYTATKPVAIGTDVFIEVKGVDHAGNKTQISENPRVGMYE
jgi:hypothetical protein